MIKTTHTRTIEGAIPHLKRGDILCPVKLVKQCRGRLVSHGKESLPEPVRMFGQYVYALPGGGEVMA